MNLRCRIFIAFFCVFQMGWSLEARAQNIFFRALANVFSCFNCFRTSSVAPEPNLPTPTPGNIILVAPVAPPVILAQGLPTPPTPTPLSTVLDQELTDLDRAMHPLSVFMRQEAYEAYLNYQRASVP